MADPPIVDLWLQSGPQTQLVLYGATNKNYVVLSTNALPETAGDWPVLATASMTNSFRLFAPAAATEAQRFYRAKEL